VNKKKYEIIEKELHDIAEADRKRIEDQEKERERCEGTAK
jgi:hypothetical protein